MPHVVLAGSKKIPTNWPDWLLTYGGAVNVETGGGSIDVGTIGGELALRTGGGSIKVGAAKGKIKAETGWDLKVSPDLRSTPPPNVEDLRILREKVDPHKIWSGAWFVICWCPGKLILLRSSEMGKP